jgi:hypothetical protein
VAILLPAAYSVNQMLMPAGAINIQYLVVIITT